MDRNAYIENLCRGARSATHTLANLSSAKKNQLLRDIAAALRTNAPGIIAANMKDLDAAKKAGLSSAMCDRLLLNEKGINSMAVSIEEIASFEEPVGRIENMRVRPSGIRVGQMRIPLGVVLVIYESRPNVTTDIAALCIKSGNACILRGGEEAIYSNTALYGVLEKVILSHGLPAGSVTFMAELDRDLVPLLLKQNRYIDVVIPRGGVGLISMVTRESNIPVIKHDYGICHIFLDESADTDMSIRIAINAMVQRPSACNAMETLLVHEKFPGTKKVLQALADHNVEIRGCERTRAIMPGLVAATDADWDTEYLDLVLSVKIVNSLEEAMDHIAKHSSSHSESIITDNYSHAERFLKEVDSSAVFVNSSTRFHDGGEFGLGAEVGISTGRFHARGAMGVEGLTTLKYVVYGNGEVR